MELRRASIFVASSAATAVALLGCGSGGGSGGGPRAPAAPPAPGPVFLKGPTAVALALPSAPFEAEFRPAISLDGSTATAFVIDWRPAVRADTTGGSPSFALEDDVQAFPIGAASPGSPAVAPTRLDGAIAT